MESVSACGWSCTADSTAVRGRVTRRPTSRNMSSRSEAVGTIFSLADNLEPINRRSPDFRRARREHLAAGEERPRGQEPRATRGVWISVQQGDDVSERSEALADDAFGGRQLASHERMTGQPWDASYDDGPAPWTSADLSPQSCAWPPKGSSAGAVLDAGAARPAENALHILARIVGSPRRRGRDGTGDRPGDGRRAGDRGRARCTYPEALQDQEGTRPGPRVRMTSPQHRRGRRRRREGSISCCPTSRRGCVNWFLRAANSGSRTVCPATSGSRAKRALECWPMRVTRLL